MEAKYAFALLGIFALFLAGCVSQNSAATTTPVPVATIAPNMTPIPESNGPPMPPDVSAQSVPAPHPMY